MQTFSNMSYLFGIRLDILDLYFTLLILYSKYNQFLYIALNLTPKYAQHLKLCFAHETNFIDPGLIVLKWNYLYSFIF